MSDIHREAAEELSLDLDFAEACRFLRSETGISLRECGYIVVGLSRKHTESILAKSIGKIEKGLPCR